MSKLSSSVTKDTIIIIFITVVFVTVFYIFYLEIIKNYKIKLSKNNFYTVKEELLKEVEKCRDEDQSWIFGNSCKQKLTTKIISNYYNKTKQLSNPYDGHEGVEGTAGSVQINIKNNLLVLSIDIDASGGIDIEHKMYY